jgi:hypothetical protein
MATIMQRNLCVEPEWLIVKMGIPVAYCRSLEMQEGDRTVFSDQPCPKTGKQLENRALQGNVVQSEPVVSDAPSQSYGVQPAAGTRQPVSGDDYQPPRNVCPSDQEVKNLRTQASSISLTLAKKEFSTTRFAVRSSARPARAATPRAIRSVYVTRSGLRTTSAVVEAPESTPKACTVPRTRTKADASLPRTLRALRVRKRIGAPQWRGMPPNRRSPVAMQEVATCSVVPTCTTKEMAPSPDRMGFAAESATECSATSDQRRSEKNS